MKNLNQLDKPSGMLFDLDATLYINDEAQEADGLRAISGLAATEADTLLSRLRVASETEEAQMLADFDANCQDMQPETASIGRSIVTEWLLPMRLTPDAEILLSHLDSVGVPYGIVTNAPPVQWLKIVRLGLHKRAGAIVVSGDAGLEKPDPKIFELAANRLGMDLARLLMAGDCLRSDIWGACDAGLQAAWILREGFPTPIPALPDKAVMIRQLTELLPLF
jgi:HAD superfamily hydrolase (TIGR01549 family)